MRLSPPSPRSPSLASLQAAATINAGLHRSPSAASPARAGTERRRSSLMNNFAINDPAIPAPGEMQHASSGSGGNSPRLSRRSFGLPAEPPHHGRQVNLGELHQELENEQEAQVNRLLHMIRIQQDQIAGMSTQQQPSEASPTSTEQSIFPTPPSNPATSLGTNITEQHSPRAAPASGAAHPHAPFNRPPSLSRQSSWRLSTAGTSSRGGSPALRPVSASLGPLTEDFLLGGTRDESAFYQAETQMLTRENQMLKHRIRELGTSSPRSFPISQLGLAFADALCRATDRRHASGSSRGSGYRGAVTTGQPACYLHGRVCAACSCYRGRCA